MRRKTGRVTQLDKDKIWRRALLSADANIQQAIRNLNDSGLQIVLAVSESGVLVGTLTDGDVRRGLLRGLDLESPIDSIIRREALVAPPEMNRESVINLMRANKIHQLPVVDANRRVTGLHLWEHVSVSPSRARPNMMVIMAGGLGTRLRPHTETCPKPLLPVDGKPILEHIIERARAEGFRHFVLAVRYLGHMIEEHFGNGDRLGVRIDYVREDTPLGTAGAIGLMNPRPDKPFVVTNGDVLTDIRYADMLEFHNRCSATATMAVGLHVWQHPFGVVQTKGIDIVGFEEKPIARTHINAGVYVLDPFALELLDGVQHCDMPTLFEKIQNMGKRTVAFPMHEPWLDVGRPDDLARANGQKNSNVSQPEMTS